MGLTIAPGLQSYCHFITSFLGILIYHDITLDVYSCCSNIAVAFFFLLYIYCSPSWLERLHIQLGGAFESVLVIHSCVVLIFRFDVGYGTRSVVCDDLYLHDSCHGMWHRVPHRIEAVFM